MSDAYSLTPVDDVPQFDPLENAHGTGPTGNVAGNVAAIGQNIGQRAADWYQAQPSWADRLHHETELDQQALAEGGPRAMLARDPTQALDLMGGFVGQTIGAPRAAAAPVFRSAVEDTVANAKLTRAPINQWTGYLKNQPGVKAEELDSLGLSDLPQGQPITKEQLQQHIADNKVQLGEVWKGEGAMDPAFAGIRDNLNTVEDVQKARRFNANFRETYKNVSDEDVLSAVKNEQLSGPTKFQGYQLPGGENYREMLLTLPKEGSGGKRVRVYTQNGLSGIQVMTDEQVAQMAASGRRKFEVLNDVNPKDAFQSPHWDEPNVLAHARMNDRDIDGSKTLHLEELQSDWHQKGRQQGYRDDQEQELANLVKRREELTKQYQSAPNQAESLRLTDELNAVHDRIYDLGRGDVGVPSAPFKATWPDLMLKRMIGHAVNNGYDAISWTPGEAQAARYDLSKQIDELHYNPDTWRLVARNNGRDMINEANVKPEQLPDYIGKEAAQKLMEQGSNSNGLRSLRGQQLQIGGNGMKGFYDQMLPAKANALGKKYGAKVETKQIPQMDTSGFELSRDGGGWRLVDNNRHGGAFIGPLHRSGADAEKWIQENATKPVHFMRITPAMREAIQSKGFPMFKRGGAVTGAYHLTPVAHDPFATPTKSRRQRVAEIVSRYGIHAA